MLASARERRAEAVEAALREAEAKIARYEDRESRRLVNRVRRALGRRASAATKASDAPAPGARARPKVIGRAA